MIYRDYGKTGEKVSLLGFGGMRFAHIDDHDECIQMMVKAAEGGVTYFDTAPDYFGVKSETVFGKGFEELRRRKLPYYAATKTFKSKEEEIRREIEAQLKRLNIPAIDFYHIWCITSLDNWRARKKNGILETFRKLKDEGLIRHICISSHLIQDEIEELLMEGVFEGVLFGYSAYNFKTREKAFNAIRAKQLGAVVMNPLGGGIIPQHPELFSFLRRKEAEKPGNGFSAVHEALRFLWDHRDITVTLVGFSSGAEVSGALAAMEGYKPRAEAELAAIKAAASASFEGLCTGCAYCDDCPQDIPIPQYMDAYNQKLLTPAGDEALYQRLSIHWGIPAGGAAKCVACGQCENACTQHLEIIKRLRFIAERKAG
ncbi:MAG: aldo/keto reductase [Treponema sp.]|jgi:predicted aldo/keto reductase-like oxidoreductase|nr:aldo/keto reductase [Treponema sp.]